MVVIKKKETQEEKDARKEQESAAASGIQDEYQAKGFELVSWVQDHRGLVSGAIAGVILLGAAFSAYNYYGKRKDEEASAAYLEALKPTEDEEKTVDKETNLTIQKSLDELIKKYPSSDVSVLAGLHAGFIALENNDFKAALDYYQLVLTKVRTSDEFYPLALLGVSKALDLNGKPEEATQNLEKIINSEKNFPGRDMALLEAARINKANKDKAAKYLSMLIEDYPESIYEKQAKKLQSSL